MIFDQDTLPSRTLPYKVKQIEVNPFRPKQIGLLSKALYLETMEPAIDAMQEVCDFDVRMLTPGDFYYLLAWQRFNCMKRPVIAQWECDAATHKRSDNGEVYSNDRIVRLVEAWQAAEGTPEQVKLENPDEITFDIVRCAHENMQNIVFEDFTILRLPEQVGLDPRIDYARVKHMAEYDKLITDPVYHKIVGPARYVAHGNTLKEKIDFLFEQETLELFELAAEANAILGHGISRTLRKACGKCGHKHAFQTSIEPASFFV